MLDGGSCHQDHGVQPFHVCLHVPEQPMQVLSADFLTSLSDFHKHILLDYEQQLTLVTCWMGLNA